MLPGTAERAAGLKRREQMKRACLLGALALLVAAPPALGATGKIVFASNRADGDRELYIVNADGSGEHRLTFNDLFERAPAWSPDSSRIAFAAAARTATGTSTPSTRPAAIFVASRPTRGATTTQGGRPTVGSSGSAGRSTVRARSG
jgi:dipeptidyl aminopeptidase/acylaminoacyl peptidase